MTQKTKSDRPFYRYAPSPRRPIYWIIIAYIVLAYFFPVVGWVALICMIGPVVFSIKKGRWWCGHVCPRGNLYDKLLAKHSPHKPIPKFVRTKGFRIFMVMLIFTMFGVQMYFAWGDWGAMGRVFWNIIVLTTIVGVVLNFIYAPRTWCSFCPMGTLSSWVAPKKAPLHIGFKRIYVTDNCKSCRSCARVCPMQIEPYSAKGNANGYLHPDCLKCGMCVGACKFGTITLK